MRAFPIALVVIMAACHSAPRPGSVPQRRVGNYAFRITISMLDPINGVLSIARDTVTAETAGQTCRREPGITGPQYRHHFSCFPPGGLNKLDLSIDSDRPAESSWSAVQSVQRTRERCIRTTVTARGATVCAETRSEIYFQDITVGGRLRFTAADTTHRI